MTKKKINELTNKQFLLKERTELIIEYSKHNTAGTLLSDDGIMDVLKVCDQNSTGIFIDARISENQSDEGYLVKAKDFIDALKPEKPERKEMSEKPENPEPEEKIEPKVHRKQFHQFIDHEFTQDEMIKLSKKLSKNIIEISEIKDRRDSAMSQFKSETAALVAENGELTHKINSGSEERNIKCEAEYHYHVNEKHIVRLDTGEHLSTGPIPDHERQIESFDKELDDEMELEDKAHKELLQNDAPDDRHHLPELDTTETDQSSSDGKETEVMPGEHEVNPDLIKTEEEQKELDREDAEIAKEIAENSGDLPNLPNE